MKTDGKHRMFSAMAVGMGGVLYYTKAVAKAVGIGVFYVIQRL